MRPVVAACVALLATVHGDGWLRAAPPKAPPPPPPEVKINEHAAAAATAAGVSKETLDAVAKAIREYGAAFDLGDEKRYRAAITGTPAMVDIFVQGMHSERVENALTQLAREKLPGRPVQPGTTASTQPEPYRRTDYHRRVLNEVVTIKGDNKRVTITRPNSKRISYVVGKTPQGWRVVATEDELNGVPPAKAAAIGKQQRQAFEQLKRRVEAGEFETWQEFADAIAAVRQKGRDQVKALAKPPTAPATK